jgi:hypothetical protein
VIHRPPVKTGGYSRKNPYGVVLFAAFIASRILPRCD